MDVFAVFVAQWEKFDQRSGLLPRCQGRLASMVLELGCAPDGHGSSSTVRVGIGETVAGVVIIQEVPSTTTACLRVPGERC